MDRQLQRRRVGRAIGAFGLALLMMVPFHSTASGHPVEKFWRYGRDVRTHRWGEHPPAQRRHQRWHRNHPNAAAWEHRRFHHRRLVHITRRKHAYRIVNTQRGRASFYSGRVGACGVPLTGLYAAHRSWPCGSRVSVRRGSRYVIVRVLDRGPFISGRVIDLSKEAFSRIGPTGAGVLDVSIHRLTKTRS